MPFLNSGAAWRRIILIQLAILAAAGVLLVIYLPRMAKRHAAEQAAERESRIVAFASSMLVADPSRRISASGPDEEELSHPEKLLEDDSVDHVQQVLGAPTSENADVNGGQHLTWAGTHHQLQAAFNKGVLYNVTYTNLATGHGVSVYSSSGYFQAF
jgi:hypothetical protein